LSFDLSKFPICLVLLRDQRKKAPKTQTAVLGSCCAQRVIIHVAAHGKNRRNLFEPGQGLGIPNVVSVQDYLDTRKRTLRFRPQESVCVRNDSNAYRGAHSRKREKLVLIAIFLRDVILFDLPSAYFALIRVAGTFDPAHNLGFEGLPFCQQFFHAFRIHIRSG
jgi:hypothetical protein